mgnify:CR=1 FL=1
MGPVEILITVLVGVVCLAAGVLVGILYRKNVAEAKIGTAEQKAKELVEEGTKQAETLKKEALLSAKEEIMRQKNDMEQEIKERRAEVSRTESRLSKKEENLDKKSEQLDKKNEQLDKKLKECDAVREQIDTTLEEQKLMSRRHSSVYSGPFLPTKKSIFTPGTWSWTASIRLMNSGPKTSTSTSASSRQYWISSEE